MKLDFRRVMLPLSVLACGAFSVNCLVNFAWGMFYAQDLWNVDVFAGYLMGGLIASIAAAVGAEYARRTDKVLAGSVFGGTLIVAAYVLCLLQVGVFLYCNAGPMRTLSTALVRRSVSFGMARDLPIPPAAD